MDKRVCVPEKSGSNERSSDGNFPEITCREINWESLDEVLHTAELYWFFCDKVNQEDVSGLVYFDLGGEQIGLVEAEARLYAYKTAGAKIQLAFVGDRLAGFLIYSVVFDKLYAGRCLYCEPWTKGLKLAKELINSLQPIPRKFLFQTKKAAPPPRMLAITEERRTIVDEDEHFYTYVMEWSNGI